MRSISSGLASRLGLTRKQASGLLIGAASLLVLLAFWPTLRSFQEVWTRYNYSHGYLTAGVVLWLLWRRRDAFLPREAGGEGGAPAEGRGLALAALGGLSLVWLAAVVTNLQVVHQGVLPLIVGAWAGTMTGWRGIRRVLPALVVFYFVVPFWEVLVPPLQGLTIAFSGTAVGLAGIDATISGEIITIPSGSFRVAGSCAGLGFFIVGLLLSTLYAHLFLDRWRTRVAAVAAGALLAVLANWIRVTGLVFLGHWTEMQSGILRDHGTYGWVVFFLTFALFVPVARGLERWEEERKRAELRGASEAPEPGDEGSGDREAGDPDPARIAFAPGRAAAGGLAALLGPVLYLTVGGLPVAPSGLSAGETAREGWTVAAEAPEADDGWRPEIPVADSAEAGAWTDGSAVVQRDWWLWREQEQGAELDGVRIASGDALLDDRTLWLRDSDRWVRQAVVRDGDEVRLVWYWFRVAGVEAVSEGWMKALELWGFFRRRPHAELVAVSTPCRTDDCRRAVERLREFLRTE